MTFSSDVVYPHALLRSFFNKLANNISDLKMTKRLSKANMALIFFIAVLLLSVDAQSAFKASIQSNYYP
jgi:hypothetical protein